jgi:hypothetical protein
MEFSLVEHRSGAYFERRGERGDTQGRDAGGPAHAGPTGYERSSGRMILVATKRTIGRVESTGAIVRISSTS